MEGFQGYMISVRGSQEQTEDYWDILEGPRIWYWFLALPSQAPAEGILKEGKFAQGLGD